ncbi:MAG: hypothetical protein EZS28_044433, partial [Streblomastix strix]
MVSRLIKEQLGSLGRLIGFFGMHDLSNETVLHARFEIENALKYYQVARPYTFFNDLKQRIVAAVQQQQQEELQKTSQEQASSSSATPATTTSEDQVDEQDDLQTMTSKLTIEQLETLSRLIGFVDVNDQFVTESSLRFKLQRAIQYYNVPGPYIYSNQLLQRIVAAVQQRQQEILKQQDQDAQRRRQATLLPAHLGEQALLPAHLDEQLLPAQEKEKEKDNEPPKQKKDPIKIIQEPSGYETRSRQSYPSLAQNLLLDQMQAQAIVKQILDNQVEIGDPTLIDISNVNARVAAGQTGQYIS